VDRRRRLKEALAVTIWESNALRADVPRTVGPRSSPGPYFLAGTIGAELRTYCGVELTRMEHVLRKPAVISAIVAIVLIATMLVVDHTNLIVDRRPPHTPPGTTFNAVNNAGAEITPSPPESPIKLPSAGPKPVDLPPARPN
jgi:hypothetical protein